MPLMHDSRHLETATMPKLWYTMKYYSATKRNESLIYATTWENLKNIMVMNSNLSQHSAYSLITFIWFSRTGKIICCSEKSDDLLLWIDWEETWGSFLYFDRVFILFYFLFFGCSVSSLVLTGFLQLLWAGATLCCSVRASHCGGFSCCRAWALEHRVNSCGAWALLLHSTWDLPGPGIEPVSPTLTGGFLNTVPPGKPW